MATEIEQKTKSDITFRGASEVRVCIGLAAGMTAGLLLAVWYSARALDAPLDPSWTSISLIASATAGFIGLAAACVRDEIRVDGSAKTITIKHYFYGRLICSRSLDGRAVTRVFTTYSREFDDRRQIDWIRIYLETVSGRTVQLYHGKRYTRGLRAAMHSARLLERPFSDESSSFKTRTTLPWDWLKKSIEHMHR